MNEKLTRLLFKPSTLIEYRKVKWYKVFLFVFVLALFSSIIPAMDMIKHPGYEMTDKDTLEAKYKISLINAAELPNCQVSDGVYSCEDHTPAVLGYFMNYFVVVSDIDHTYTAPNNKYTLRFMSDRIEISNGPLEVLSVSYTKLPAAWQSFDFSTIKNAQSPNDEYFLLFLTGFNQILKVFLPFNVALLYIIAYFVQIAEILFFSLLFHLLYRRAGNYRYTEIMRITTFAYALPVLLTLLFNLIGWSEFGGLISMFLLFMYVGRALVPIHIEL